MNLKLGVHSQYRLMERGIDIDHVKAAVRDPDHTVKNDDGSIKAIKRIGKKKIVVIYSNSGFKDKKGEIFIRTCYYI